MAELRTLVSKVRSKNAGPFWLTIDIFCGSPEAYVRVSRDLATTRIASVFDADSQTVKRFDIPDLNVVKFSLPRPTVQGALVDRDMHGASWAALVGELDI
ncbi:DUF4387 domain-containing protein [Roseobacter sinensis]|uniref:DUF4387 domain-containing protein n=1 Tax=Roseobacter sinensis TaxID=2931391 RepID=A0ABT3BD98_9RHOB|nr:DUF4387 domain-containing protein [Roseobacter sp. WL0113]MCV3271543.1 DUF4387 domain-containing protein [Roseobacter sp. WL0113]